MRQDPTACSSRTTVAVCILSLYPLYASAAETFAPLHPLCCSCCIIRQQRCWLWCCMKRTAGLTGSPSPIAACRSHRCRAALLVVTILVTSGVVAARDFPAAASETFPAPSPRNESAAESQANPAFSLSLDAYHSQGLRRHSRSLKQSSCPNAGTA